MYENNTSPGRKQTGAFPGAENKMTMAKDSPRAKGKRITDNYLEALQPQTPARSNSQAFLNIKQSNIGSRSPSPTRKPMVYNKDDVSLMRSSSTVYFRTMASNSTPSADDPSSVCIPGVTDSTEDVIGKVSKQ